MPPAESHLPELQRAVRELPGVVSATVRWPDPLEPPRLRVEFDALADREGVARDVLAVIAEVGGVDLGTLEVVGGLVGEVGARQRPVLADLVVEQAALDATVTVTLTLDGRRATGRERGLASPQALLRTAARATLAALREMLSDDVRVEVDWLDMVDPAGSGRSNLVQVAITCLSSSGEDAVVGSAYVRGQPYEAAVRATLDALNRRLERLARAA